MCMAAVWQKHQQHVDVLQHVDMLPHAMTINKPCELIRKTHKLG